MNYSKNYEDFRRLHENVSKMTAQWNGRNGSNFEFCDVIIFFDGFAIEETIVIRRANNVKFESLSQSE